MNASNQKSKEPAYLGVWGLRTWARKVGFVLATKLAPPPPNEKLARASMQQHQRRHSEQLSIPRSSSYSAAEKEEEVHKGQFDPQFSISPSSFVLMAHPQREIAATREGEATEDPYESSLEELAKGANDEGSNENEHCDDFLGRIETKIHNFFEFSYNPVEQIAKLQCDGCGQEIAHSPMKCTGNRTDDIIHELKAVLKQPNSPSTQSWTGCEVATHLECVDSVPKKCSTPGKPYHLAPVFIAQALK